MSDTISVQAIISARDAGYKAAMADAIAQSQQLERASESCAAGISKIAIGNVVAKGVTAAFGAITNAIGGAVKRIDTLNNFKPVMQSLGFSAEEAESSINKLSEGIDGLPTTLDGIVSSAQMLTASLGDLSKGTEAAVALNDMFLAGGQGAEAAARGLTQYNQMLAKGKVDQQSWNTLVEVAPGQLKQLASELVGASASQKDLYDALQSGKISMEEFNNTVIRLDQEGGQGFQSFADQARAATGGIATAWQNVQTAVVKGVASVIDAIDKTAKATTGSGIADAFNSVKEGIKRVFDVIAQVASKVTAVLAPAFRFLGDHIETVVKVIGTLATGFAALKIIDTVKTKIDNLRNAISTIRDNFKKYNEVIQKYGSISKAQQAATEASTKAIEARKKAEEASKQVTEARRKLEQAELTLRKAEMAATMSETGAEEANLAVKEAKNGVMEASEGLTAALTVEEGALAGAEVAEAAATETATAAQEGLNAAMEANPLGIVIMAVTGLIAGLTMLADAFSGLTDEEKKAKEEEQAYLDSCRETSDAVHNNAEAAKRNAAEIDVQSQKIDNLVGRIVTLNNQEKLSTEEKEELASKTAQLNSYVEDLNLTIDKETGKIKDSTKAVLEKVKAYEKQQKAQAIEENLKTALEERDKLLAQQAELEQKVADAAEGKLAIQKKEAEWYDFIVQAANGAAWEINHLAAGIEEGQQKVQAEYDATNEAIAENDALLKQYTNDAVAMEEEEQAAAEAAAQAERDARQQQIRSIADYIASRQQMLANAITSETLTLDMLSEANQATVEELQSVWQGYTDKATDMFSTLSDKIMEKVEGTNEEVAKSAESIREGMMAAMRENQRIIQEWGDNMASLRERFEGMNLDTAVLDQFQNMGPEGAAYVAAFVEASDAELQDLANVFGNGGNVAMEALGKSLGEDAQGNLEAVSSLVTNVKDSLSTEVAKADWTEVGTDIVTGFAAGIGADDEAVQAGQRLANDTENATRAALASNSPSKVYEGIGSDINQGLTNGIARSASNPINTAQQVAEAVMNATKAALSNMFSIGVYAMQGFANGLRAMAGAVMATAASIANSAAATISAALKVGSPSKVLTRIGEWTGEGFVIGLESTERAVEKTMNKIADISSRITVPDLLGNSGRTFRTELAFAGDMGFTTEIDSLRAEVRELKEAVQSQPILVQNDMSVDGRSFAKGVTTYIRKESDKQTRLANNLGGIK